MTLSKLCLGVLIFFTPFVSRGAASLDDILDGYNEVVSALAKDNLADSAAQAAKLVPLADELALAGGALAPHYKKVAAGAKALAASTKEGDIRSHMSLLSEGAVWLLKETPALQSKWQLYKCPMVGGGAFSFWIQPVGDSMANPFWSTTTGMLGCGLRRAWAKFP